jgi:hypothetical protein
MPHAKLTQHGEKNVDLQKMGEEDDSGKSLIGMQSSPVSSEQV